jgi:hypothetical protein
MFAQVPMLMSHCLRTALVALVLISGTGLGAQTFTTPNTRGTLPAANTRATQQPLGAATPLGTSAPMPAAAQSGGQAAALQQTLQTQSAKQDAARSLEAPDVPGPDAPTVRPASRLATPGQFQRFVQETTGQLLPLYGHDLFDTPLAYAADSALPAPRRLPPRAGRRSAT